MKRPNSAFSLVELSIVILIIGVLVAAVGQGIDLLQDSRIQAARVISQGSRVPAIKDLVLWLDSTAESSFLASEASDGSPISAWNDSNPQRDKNNFTQSVEAQKPTYRESSINNLPAISFDGVADNMFSTTFPIIASREMTVFAVVKTASTLPTPYTAIVSKRSATNAGVVNLELSQGSGNQGFLIHATYGMNSWNIATNTSYIASFSISSSFAIGLLNGKGFFNVPGGLVPGTALISTDYLFIGRQGVTASPTYFGGSIGELIIYDRALPKKERQSIESYLGKKWGIKMTVESAY
jgi:prepilin-type N-terminal cleavage/methylation domain-containing protein